MKQFDERSLLQRGQSMTCYLYLEKTRPPMTLKYGRNRDGGHLESIRCGLLDTAKRSGAAYGASINLERPVTLTKVDQAPAPGP